MHLVGHDVVQQALVVGHQNDGPLEITQAVDALGDDMQGVDVEARVSFVEYGQMRFQHRHLQDLVAFFLAAGETLVDRAIQKTVVHAEQCHPVLHIVEEIDGIHLGFAASAALAVERGAQQLHIGDTGNLHRILKRQEDTGAGAFFRVQR
jgi:hypothetical protein